MVLCDGPSRGPVKICGAEHRALTSSRMGIGIVGRQAFRGGGGKQPRIRCGKYERPKSRRDQPRVTFESGCQLQSIIRPEWMLLQQVFRPVDEGRGQLYYQILASRVAIQQQADSARDPRGNGSLSYAPVMSSPRHSGRRS